MGIVLLVLLTIPASVFIALQSSAVQTYVANKTLNYLSDNLQADFSLGKISFSFFNRLVLHEAFIRDQAGDTLIYGEKIVAHITGIKPGKRTITLGKIRLTNSMLRLHIDSTRTVNIKFFANLFTTKTDAPKGDRWEIEFKRIHMDNGRFYLSSSFRAEESAGIDFSDMKLLNLNIDLRRFRPIGDTLEFTVSSINFREQSGFELLRFKAVVSICPRHLRFSKISFSTPLSNFQGKYVFMSFSKYTDFSVKTLFDKVIFDAYVNESQISLSDLAYFTDVFKGSDQTLEFSSRVKGSIGNFSFRDINLQFGQQSLLQGEVDMTGLPNIGNTFTFARLKNVRTSYDDLIDFRLPGQRRFKIPEIIKGMDIISYKGDFTGFINDFVAYGTLDSKLGTVKTDILIKPDSTNMVAFKGNVNTLGFDLGKLIDNDDLGNIDLNISSSGWITRNKKVHANLDGLIGALTYKNYRYTNIKLTGLLGENDYDGEIQVNDDNIRFQFKGFIDFSKETSRYDFLASVAYANLYALNIDRSDPGQYVSFDLEAKAAGNTLNDLTGELSLVNALFVKSDKQIQIYDINLTSENNGGTKEISLKSDFVDAVLKGNFEIDKIGGAALTFFQAYLPSLIDSGRVNSEYGLSNTFDLQVKFMNPKPLFDFFYPDFYPGDNAHLTVNYSPDVRRLFVHFRSPNLYFKGNNLEDLYITVTSGDTAVSLHSGSSRLVLRDRVSLENFTVVSEASYDQLNILTRWNNWDSSLYRGSLKAMVTFQDGKNNVPLKTVIDLLPSTIITYDTLWNINAGQIALQKNYIEFQNIFINHNHQYFNLSGRISEDPEDRIYAVFNDFNLENLNVFTSGSGFTLRGILNGNAQLSDMLKRPHFYSRLVIDTFYINNEILGNTYINSEWNPDSRAINIDAFARRGLLKTLSIKGDYFPQDDGRLNFFVEVDKLRLDLFAPYVQSVARNLRGIASGSLTVDGTVSKPLVNGEVMLQKTGFSIDYLKTQYYFTSNIKVINNNVLFNRVEIIDEYAKKAILNGSLTSNYFRDFKINLNIQANNFHLLNTTQRDNDLFYGTAFATGLVRITGTPQNINMDISARTDRNTRFYIPLSNKERISEYNFIRVNHYLENQDEPINGKRYSVNLSGIQMNFDLEITPDAMVQLIFDPTVGDILESRGQGNLKLQINTLGRFSMYGNYTITEGEYLFTMLNLINRRFSLESGGLISWSGSPLGAQIDLSAIYRTKASLTPLLGPISDTRSKTTVDCVIKMSGRLMNPDITYDLQLPFSDDAATLRVKNAINTNEDMIRQFSSMLVMNSFLPTHDMSGSQTGSASTYGHAANANASELLSNQLGNWLSQLNSNVDFGINWRRDRELRSDDIEVALSMLLFNDRLTINGSVDVPTNATKTASSAIVGDVDLDYKLTQSGKIRVKAFNHSNENLLFLTKPYTQGVGFVFKEEFNSFGELWRRLWPPFISEESRKRRQGIEGGKE